MARLEVVGFQCLVNLGHGGESFAAFHVGGEFDCGVKVCCWWGRAVSVWDGAWKCCKDHDSISGDCCLVEASWPSELGTGTVVGGKVVVLELEVKCQYRGFLDRDMHEVVEIGLLDEGGFYNSWSSLNSQIFTSNTSKEVSASI